MILTPEILWLGVLLFVFALAAIVLNFLFQPLYYIIDSKGIEIHTCFRGNTYVWWDIYSIHVSYAVGFSRFLLDFFIKDYVLTFRHTKNTDKQKSKMNRIAKTGKFTKLLNEYCPKSLLEKLEK